MEAYYYNYFKSNNILVDNYVVLDFETTGLNTNNNHIIEVALLKYENDILVDELVTLIDPCIAIPPYITSLTGIDDEMVYNMPKIEDIIQQMVDFIGNNIILGHNITFDLRFLVANMKRYIYDDKQYIFKYIDTLQLARKYLNYLPNHRLETLKNYYGIQEISHRAKQDCLTTQNIYLKIKEIAN